MPDLKQWTDYAGFVAVWFMLALGAGIIASDKQRRFWLWFLLGLALGPIALVWSFTVSRAIPPGERRLCPHCGGTIHVTADRCSHCRRAVTAEKPDAAARLGREAAGAVFILRHALGRRRPATTRRARRAGETDPAQSSDSA